MTTRVLALAALALGLAATAVRADEKTDNAKARADAARRVYQSLWDPSTQKTLDAKATQTTSATLDRAYTWSLRWMEAEEELAGDDADARIKAVRGHVDRMRTAQTVVRAQAERQSATDADLATQRYYLLASEQALAQARDKQRGSEAKPGGEGKR